MTYETKQMVAHNLMDRRNLARKESEAPIAFAVDVMYANATADAYDHAINVLRQADVDFENIFTEIDVASTNDNPPSDNPPDDNPLNGMSGADLRKFGVL